MLRTKAVSHDRRILLLAGAGVVVGGPEVEALDVVGAVEVAGSVVGAV